MGCFALFLIVNIFLLQNYQPVGTLDDWMVGKQQTASSITTVEVLEYANQIVAGMEMIVTYGVRRYLCN